MVKENEKYKDIYNKENYGQCATKQSLKITFREVKDSRKPML